MPTTSLALMQYRLLPLQLVPMCHNSTSSDDVPFSSLTVGTTMPATELFKIQYWLLPLQLVSLYLQHHYFDAVRVTCLTVGTTVPATELATIQYWLFPLQLVSLYLQQHYVWCSTGYLPYSWHHCARNSTSSDAVPVTCQLISSSSTDILHSLVLSSHL